MSRSYLYWAWLLFFLSTPSILFQIRRKSYLDWIVIVCTVWCTCAKSLLDIYSFTFQPTPWNTKNTIILKFWFAKKSNPQSWFLFRLEDLHFYTTYLPKISSIVSKIIKILQSYFSIGHTTTYSHVWIRLCLHEINLHFLITSFMEACQFKTGRRWGFLNFPPGVISSESSPDGTVFMSMGTGPVVLREENASFLATLPALRTYEPVDPDDPKWNSKMVAAGKPIRDDLLQDYPLGFKRPGETDTFADVKPAQITVDEGARPINPTYCKEIPPWLESECNALIESLLADKTIIRMDRPTSWCSPACFVRKANGPWGWSSILRDWTLPGRGSGTPSRVPRKFIAK